MTPRKSGGQRRRTAAAAAGPDADSADRRHRADNGSQVARYTVRAVAHRLGVPTATLRSWTHRYGVGPLEHSPGRHRLYTETDIVALQRMSELIAQGVNLRSAARAAMETLIPPPTQTASLKKAAFALDEPSAGRIVERHLRHYGVLKTWDSLIRPVFAEIESRQAAGDRCIDVEHLLSWTVVRCLQRAPMASGDTTATVILACTEDETHTLPLEVLRAALCERDHEAMMLGAAVPAAAIVDALTRRTDSITVVLWAQTARTADPAAVETVLAAQTQVMVAGPGWDSLPLPAAVAQLHTLDDAVQRLTSADYRGPEFVVGQQVTDHRKQRGRVRG